jgi:hypothetical protein
VALLELPDDRDDRLRLGLGCLIAADLQGEPGPVDQEPDHDLGVDAAFLGEPDLAEVVFLVCLEVERGDVVEHQRHIGSVQDVGECCCRSQKSARACLPTLV